MEEFRAQIIGNGISYDIVKKGFTLDKTGISNWLKEKSILHVNDNLLSFEELKPWIRTGGETYSTTFIFSTNDTTYWLIAKALVTLNPEKSLLDWERRRKILLDNNVPVSNWFWIGEGTIIETYYPKTFVDVVNFEDLIKMAFSIDKLGFVTLKFLDDIRCDVFGYPFYVDFGFDLGEPSGNHQYEAKGYLIKQFPAKEKEINMFYSSNF
ncbi:hypothetical protein A2467_02310 [Candidatus Nomurabacteria bacterium RIFOXYC2_FULL_36_8]|nr:MAG: hypothetical protein US00_C0006G0054 [Candidatus Nomurabacteria bacterium GW2011_GWF2_36_126]KKP97123.1 MAG: hypothetical protein US04_C0001G0626 [Candidatus Nomurabacteria bacterium GW2011_GWD2_36_14]KKP99267.1 MAG: hypothetical protein US08_C0002G0090 [Candidatus Nomurabacteria bacterium GW2011_GWF2_36_19]KKQ05914.1 MAG: hypothetical protein US17_C0001G0092 [Candidatus Nomurabacteria bacterium GW2011_GWF1_36_47]KKQ09408.1 MAG: hypothetical protein US21_C0005G0065 [Candidatus Nomurabac